MGHQLFGLLTITDHFREKLFIQHLPSQPCPCCPIQKQNWDTLQGISAFKNGQIFVAMISKFEFFSLKYLWPCPQFWFDLSILKTCNLFLEFLLPRITHFSNISISLQSLHTYVYHIAFSMRYSIKVQWRLGGFSRYTCIPSTFEVEHNASITVVRLKHDKNEECNWVM